MTSILYRDKTVIIRADGSAEIGIGHLMRCVALAQGFRRASVCPRFISKNLDGTAREVLSSCGFEPILLDDSKKEDEDATATLEIAREQKAKFVIIDHYGLKEPFRNFLKAAGLRLLVFDDIGDSKKITADIILNQNLGAASLLPRYKEIAPDAIAYLLGEKYVLLRDEIVKTGKMAREKRQQRLKDIIRGNKKPTILIIFGGSDIKGYTPIALAQLRDFTGYYDCALVACSRSRMKIETLTETIMIAGSLRQTLIFDTPELPKMMSKADIAITAGGSTTQELAYLGVAMIIVQVAANQRIICQGFAQKEAAIVIMGNESHEEALKKDLYQLLSKPEDVSLLSQKVLKIIDSHGRDRILKILANNHLY